MKIIYQVHTDDTSFFGIVHFAKTYGFLDQIGYFYNNNPNRKNKIEEKANRIMRSYFNIMKYFLIKSDNNTDEKSLMPYNFFYKKVRKECKEIVNKIFIKIKNLFSQPSNKEKIPNIEAYRIFEIFFNKLF